MKLARSLLASVSLLLSAGCIGGAPTARDEHAITDAGAPEPLSDPRVQAQLPRLGLAAGYRVLTQQAGLDQVDLSQDDLADRSQALHDAEAAREQLDRSVCNVVLHDMDLGASVLVQGVTCLEGVTRLDGELVLDAQGNDRALFILRIAGSLDVGPGASVRLSNCGHSESVFWSVESDVMLGKDASLSGTLWSGGDIALEHGASLHGRAFATHGRIRLSSTSHVGS